MVMESRALEGGGGVSYLVRSLEEPVDARELVDEGDVLPEGVERRARGLREVGAVERIGVI